jgi:hypothetical protein
MEVILRVSGEVEKSLSGRCQLGDRRSYPKTWIDCARAHG